MKPTKAVTLVERVRSPTWFSTRALRGTGGGKELAVGVKEQLEPNEWMERLVQADFAVSLQR